MVSLSVDEMPFGLLHDIERRSLESGAELPREEERKPGWTGVAFKLDGNLMAVSLHDMAEVMDCPPCTPVPRTKAWLKGIANVRGRLLPVVDLQVYLGGERRPSRRNARLLILNHGALSAAVLVDEVFGQRHFLDENRCPLPTLESGGVMSYVRPFAYQKDNDLWLVFDARKLMMEPEFVRAAR
ncbi:MAG: chemotaxis protein CheW [Pseudomonadota bacterium]